MQNPSRDEAMSGHKSLHGGVLSGIKRHARLVGALFMREIVTRFGRESAGFLWVIGEPLLFCAGVLVLWSAIKPAYEHGVRLGPFVMTGYMCLLLLRHMLSMSVGALQANVGMLYHRQITPIHIFIARNFMEFCGGTVAFIVVYVALYAIGEVGLPHDWLLLYAGWFLMAWVSIGFALVMAGLAMKYEVMERVTSLVGYVIIPFSGAFTMASWVPSHYRDLYLMVPFPHGVEMVRSAVFGEFVETHFNPAYAFAFGGVLLLIGLVLISDARERILVE
ncbi:ABC transporter permease [Brevundimonas sp.]|uniref:ABC transporter permease n=1 Tax=Brevundimonas sp. TaxID=1871086 RepID=UPI00289D904D|nr:ABC transporter permease [Brevundimonas sp.]